MTEPCRALRGLLEAVVREYRRILGRNLAGIYLHGSAAFGCFLWQTSDIDLLVDLTGTNIRSLLALGSVYCDLESALGKSIDLLPVSSLEQGSQSASDALFRDAVQKERVRIYDAAS